MARKFKIPTHEEIWSRFDKGYNFNEQIGLYDQVTVNENFFIGNQWEGVEANGLPTPTYNMFKRIINFQVSTITSDNLVVRALPMPSTSKLDMRELEKIAEIVSQQFAAIVKRNRIVDKNREFLRNAAVTGDGCMHFYFDPTIENGQDVKGEIVAEIIDNLRVMFGNPNCRDVQRQPFIIIYRREMVDEVRYKAEQYKDAGLCEIEDIDSIKADSDKFQNKYDSFTDDKVTVVTYYFRNRDTGTIWCIEATEQGILREAYDTEYKLYPLIWINWDYIRDCYHGQAMVTGLLPNQKFINKMFIEMSHNACKWVVCIDPAIDRRMLETTKSRIIGFTTGEGCYGELNVTVSARKDILSDIKDMLTKRISEKFSNWDHARLQKAAAFCVDEMSKHMDGSRILKALNPYDYEIHSFLAYILTLQMLELTQPNDEYAIRALISLDSYKHWFAEDDELSKDNKRPDFMLIEIPKSAQNLDPSEDLQIRIKIIECKMGFQNDKHLEKAQTQLEKGLRTMSANWNPNNTSIMTKRLPILDNTL